MMNAVSETKTIRKALDRVEVDRTPCVAEDPVEKEFRLIRDSKGNCSYVEVGERNVRDYIASFANGCSLKSILDRCSLMPVRDKIAYMNQREDGLGADLSNMPKDGTEAQIMIQKVKNLCPDYAERLKNGESFEKLVLELLPKEENIPVPDVEKEGEVNG